MSIFRQLINKKVLKILDLLLRNKDKLFHLNKISDETKVPLGSTFRLVNQLVALNLLEVIVIGKMKIYKLADNENVKELEFVFKRLKDENKK